MDIGIHRVSRIEIERVERDTIKHDGRVFYTRRIGITDEDGRTDKITLFSDTREGLDLVSAPAAWVLTCTGSERAKLIFEGEKEPEKCVHVSSTLKDTSGSIPTQDA